MGTGRPARLHYTIAGGVGADVSTAGPNATNAETWGLILQSSDPASGGILQGQKTLDGECRGVAVRVAGSYALLSGIDGDDQTRLGLIVSGSVGGGGGEGDFAISHPLNGECSTGCMHTANGSGYGGVAGSGRGRCESGGHQCRNLPDARPIASQVASPVNGNRSFGGQRVSASFSLLATLKLGNSLRSQKSA